MQKQTFCKLLAFPAPHPAPPDGGATFPSGEGFAAAPLPSNDFLQKTGAAKNIPRDVCFLSAMEEQPQGQSQLKRQDQGNSQREFPVAGFVTGGIHPCQGTDASAQQGGGQKRGLRDSPKILPGPVLVRKHKHKPQRIDYKEVDEQILHIRFLSGGMVLKTWWIAAALCLLLTGCGARETLETVADDIVQQVMAQPRQIAVELPDNAVAPVLESDSEQIYFCEEYQILVETLSGGDLEATVRSLSGCDREKLTLIETEQDGAKRYDFVWAAAGEGGDLLGRAAILDDGSYHYCLSVLRDADSTENTQVIWRNVFASFALV